VLWGGNSAALKQDLIAAKQSKAISEGIFSKSPLCSYLLLSKVRMFFGKWGD
jgi:hypothetical protein